MQHFRPVMHLINALSSFIMKNSIKVIVIALAAATLLAGCKKDQVPSSAPILPPVESVRIDLSTFTGTATKSDYCNEYFQYVVESVISNWNTLYEQIINIPVNGFEAFVNIQPVYQGDGVWMWQCDVRDGFTTYTISLLGEEQKDHVDWELAVSSEGLFTIKNFVWLTGTSSKDGREGEWKVAVGPTDLISPTDVAVTSNWQCDVNRKISKVELTYELSHLCCGINPFFHNSKLTWMAYATDDAYDHSISAYYNHMGMAWWSASVEWNSNDGSGRVKCADKWNDGAWYMWPGHVSE